MGDSSKLGVVLRMNGAHHDTRVSRAGLPYSTLPTDRNRLTGGNTVRMPRVSTQTTQQRQRAHLRFSPGQSTSCEIKLPKFSRRGLKGAARAARALSGEIGRTQCETAKTGVNISGRNIFITRTSKLHPKWHTDRSPRVDRRLGNHGGCPHSARSIGSRRRSCDRAGTQAPESFSTPGQRGVHRDAAAHQRGQRPSTRCTPVCPLIWAPTCGTGSSGEGKGHQARTGHWRSRRGG